MPRKSALHMQSRPNPLCPEYCDSAGRTHVLTGYYSRARTGYARHQHCRLVFFGVGNYKSAEVGAIFADDVFEPRMSAMNTLAKEQRAELLANLQGMGVICQPA